MMFDEYSKKTFLLLSLFIPSSDIIGNNEQNEHGTM